MLNDSGFANLATFLKSRSGLALGPDKMYLVETRLEPIVRRHGLRDLTTLADRVRAGAEPLGSEVVEAMTTNESFFFREDRAFTHLTGQVLPGAETVLGLTTRLVPATDAPGTCAYQKACEGQGARTCAFR